MAALRDISATLLSRSKPHGSLFQRLFLRRNTSKIFVKGTFFWLFELFHALCWSQIYLFYASLVLIQVYFLSTNLSYLQLLQL
jgi:hypothetical protein